MKKNTKFVLTDKHKVLIFFIIITIALVTARFYIGTKKSYYHMDEMYSYGLMNYERISITDNPDFLDEWHTKDYYLDYLEVNNDEVSNFMPVYENQKNDVHPPFYYFLLRIASMFSVDYFTKWTGIILNIIIFALSNVLVYKTSKLLFRNSLMALFVCVINGAAIVAIDSCMYIRMYELTNLFVLALTYFHVKMWRKDNITFKNLLPIMIIFILGGLTHYYFFIYGIIVYLLYSIKCLRKKNFKNFGKYQIAIIISAIIYLLIFPYSIEHILEKNNSFTGTENLSIFTRLGSYLLLINNKFFNNLIILFIILIGFICYGKRTKKLKFNSQIVLFICPILFYLITAITFSPYIETRYIIPIYSVTLITVFYFVKKFLFEHISNREVVFMLILTSVIFAYTPILTNHQFEFTYEQYSNIATQTEEKNLPIVYYFNTNNNRYLDDLYLFTLTDRSIILDANNGLDKLKNIAKEEKHFILICNDGINEDELKTQICANYSYLQRMNACNVYEVTIY